MSDQPAASPVPDEGLIRAQLERILASDIFLRSKQLSRFLSCVVEKALAKREEDLKEKILARELHGIKIEGFNSAVDTVVRVDARRVRIALLEYYSESHGDQVRISLPKGGYAPQFVLIPPPAPVRSESAAGLPSRQVNIDDAADLVGTWVSDDFKYKGDVIKAVFEFKRCGPVIAGVLRHTLSDKNALNIKGGVTEVKIEGDLIDFTVTLDVWGMHTSRQFPLRCAGVLSGDRLTLDALWEDGPAAFTAKRVPN